MSEINMTPLIDVMLVLLVIFMITAPLMSSSLKLHLPEAEGNRPGEAAAAFVTVSVDAGGQWFYDDEAVSTEALAHRVEAAARRDPDTEVQLRADRGVAYGRITELIGVLQKAGLNRIGFVTQPAVGTP